MPALIDVNFAAALDASHLPQSFVAAHATDVPVPAAAAAASAASRALDAERQRQVPIACHVTAKRTRPN